VTILSLLVAIAFPMATPIGVVPPGGFTLASQTQPKDNAKDNTSKKAPPTPGGALGGGTNAASDTARNAKPSTLPITAFSSPEMVMTGLAFGAIAFFVLTLVELIRERRVGVESHWGGFGGGLGGWQASPALLYFVGTILLAGMLTSLAYRSLPGPPEKNETQASSTDAAKKEQTPQPSKDSAHVVQAGRGG
jgi:hypothetical protein